MSLVGRTDLLGAVQRASKIVRRTPQPIVELSADDSQVTVRSAGSCWCTEHVPSHGEGFGAWVGDPKQVIEAVRACVAYQFVELSIDDTGRLVVDTPSIRAEIRPARSHQAPGSPEAATPEVPAAPTIEPVDGRTADVAVFSAAPSLADAIAGLRSCINRKQRTLAGLRIEPGEDSARLVAVLGVALSWLEVDGNVSSPVIVPAEFLPTILSLLSRRMGKVRVEADDTYIRVLAEGMDAMVSRTVDPKDFPQYRRVVPTGAVRRSFEVDTAALRSALQACSRYSSDPLRQAPTSVVVQSAVLAQPSQLVLGTDGLEGALREEVPCDRPEGWGATIEADEGLPGGLHLSLSAAITVAALGAAPPTIRAVQHDDDPNALLMLTAPDDLEGRRWCAVIKPRTVGTTADEAELEVA